MDLLASSLLPSVPESSATLLGILAGEGKPSNCFTVFTVVNGIDAGECEIVVFRRCSHLGPFVDSAPQIEVAGSSPMPAHPFYYLLHSFTCLMRVFFSFLSFCVTYGVFTIIVFMFLTCFLLFLLRLINTMLFMMCFVPSLRIRNPKSKFSS